MQTSPRAVRASETVVDWLRADILAGRLAPGSRLRQDAIAIEYGVSHIPVREAFRRLEAEGLVSIRPHHGAIVTSLSASEIEELYEIRVALECAAMRAAVPRMSAESLREAATILDRIDGDPERWPELNTAFHLALYREACRPRMYELISSLLRNCERYLRYEAQALGLFACSQQEHRELLVAVRAKDVEAACAILVRHMQNQGAENARNLRSRGLE
jgi:DNA-binding GntR family transcriptional regulator